MNDTDKLIYELRDQFTYKTAEVERLKGHLLHQSDALKSPLDVYEIVRRDELEKLKTERNEARALVDKLRIECDRLNVKHSEDYNALSAAQPLARRVLGCGDNMVPRNQRT